MALAMRAWRTMRSTVGVVEDLCTGPPDDHEAALLDPELAELLVHDPR
jgi:hypothetical protein